MESNTENMPSTKIQNIYKKCSKEIISDNFSYCKEVGVKRNCRQKIKIQHSNKKFVSRQKNYFWMLGGANNIFAYNNKPVS